MSDHSLEDIIKDIRLFVEERDWDQYHRPTSLALSLAIELGELLELFQWKSDQEIIEALKNEKYKQALSDEIADIMVYLLRIADTLGIDVIKAVTDKMKKNREKYKIDTWKSKAPSKV